jgi:uncharacterized membrane protein YeiH
MFGKEVIVGGLELGAFIILLVQTCKFLGLSDENKLKLAVLIGAVVFVVLSIVSGLVPAAAMYIDQVTMGIWAVMGAVLGWAYGVKPLAQRLGIVATVSEIE